MGRLRMCEVCKQPIEPERAEGFPDTRLCGQHAREIQAFGGEFVTSASQEVTSKAGSLKRNYGGIATTRTRNHEAVRRLREKFEDERGQYSQPLIVSTNDRPGFLANT